MVVLLGASTSFIPPAPTSKEGKQSKNTGRPSYLLGAPMFLLSAPTFLLGAPTFLLGAPTFEVDGGLPLGGIPSFWWGRAGFCWVRVGFCSAGADFWLVHGHYTPLKLGLCRFLRNGKGVW
jgi:hypothetical protein